MITDLQAGVVRNGHETQSMAGREQVGFECRDCGHRVRSIADGRNCTECESTVWDRVVTSQSTGRVRELLCQYDWGCIWCEQFFTDDQVIHEHDHGFDAPLCPNCPDHPDGTLVGSADEVLLSEFLPEPGEATVDNGVVDA